MLAIAVSVRRGNLFKNHWYKCCFQRRNFRGSENVSAKQRQIVQPFIESYVYGHTNRPVFSRIPDFCGFFFKSRCSLDHSWQLLLNKVCHNLISLGGDRPSMYYVVTHTTSGIYILMVFTKTAGRNRTYVFSKKKNGKYRFCRKYRFRFFRFSFFFIGLSVWKNRKIKKRKISVLKFRFRTKPKLIFYPHTEKHCSNPHPTLDNALTRVRAAPAMYHDRP